MEAEQDDGTSAAWEAAGVLYERLMDLESRKEPIRIGLIGAGAFGRQIASRAAALPGMRIAAIADIDVERAIRALVSGGIEPSGILVTETSRAMSVALEQGRAAATSDPALLIASEVDVVVEATGMAHAGARHAYDAIAARKHVVMVTVETDVLVGPLLRRLADRAGVIYSLAYGDEPALAYGLWEWARTNGFEVVAAGKGTRFRPSFRKATPDDVPRLYGFTGTDYNARVFGSFLDGTKHAVEMAALSNATGLLPDVRGMHFLAAELSDIPDVLSLESSGGVLSRPGVVEAISSEHPDGRLVARSLRGGVFAVLAADEGVIDSLASYGDIIGMTIGRQSRNALIYRPQHFVGHEVPYGIARTVIDRRPVAAPVGHHSDVVAAAKRILRPGTILDGEGGYTAYGIIESAATTRAQHLVPMGLLQGAEVLREIPEDAVISVGDVQLADSFVLGLRERQNAEFP